MGPAGIETRQSHGLTQGLTMLIETLILLMTLVLFIVLLQWFRSRGLPPGPRRLPIIGNFLDIAGSFGYAHLTLTKLAKIHGDVYTIEIFGKPIVIVNSIKLAHEALVTRKDDFAGRPMVFLVDKITRGGRSFADFSPRLILTRKIVQSALRMYQPRLEGKIIEEVMELGKRFQGYSEQPFDPRKDLSLAIINVICAIVYGTRFDIDDPEFLENVKFIDAASRLIGTFNILNFVPWLANFPIPSSRRLHEFETTRARLRDAKFNQHKETFQEGHIRHLSDALLKAKLDAERDDSKARQMLNDEDIMGSIDAVFGAGTETTSTTLCWLLAYLLVYPEVQGRVHAELDDVIGRDGNVELKHRGILNYLEATITEVQRCASVAPVFPHRTTCDTQLAGYKIPNDTMVLLNYSAINHDEREWDEPEGFNPSRFLNSEGKFTGTSQMSYIVFGAGRRACIGESLARRELFLISGRLLQRFRFENPPSCPLPDLKDGVLGVTWAPKPFKIVAKER